MNSETLILIEVLLIFGGALTFAFWELRSLRRSKSASKNDRGRRN